MVQLKREGAVITARWQQGALPTDPSHPLWQQAEPLRVPLYPQAAIRPGSVLRKTGTVEARALYSERELAVRLEWADGQADRQRGIGWFADAASLQFPARYGSGARLPYVGMAHPGSPVALWLWRADGSTETLAAEGFGSLSALRHDGVRVTGKWEDGTWRVVFLRKLQTADVQQAVQFRPAKQGVVPISLAIWNGDTGQRDGDKLLSAWHFLSFEKGRVDPRYARSLLWSPKMQGDPAKGKTLMAGCVACHPFPGNPLENPVGPDLSYAGGIHRPEYLLESLKNPSAIIVPGKGYATLHKGKKVSLMPAEKLPERDYYHLVEYLRTLK